MVCPYILIPVRGTNGLADWLKAWNEDKGKKVRGSIKRIHVETKAKGALIFAFRFLTTINQMILSAISCQYGAVMVICEPPLGNNSVCDISACRENYYRQSPSSIKSLISPSLINYHHKCTDFHFLLPTLTLQNVTILSDTSPSHSDRLTASYLGERRQCDKNQYMH